MSLLPINILQEYLKRLQHELQREDKKAAEREADSILYEKYREQLVKRIQDVEEAIKELKEKGEG